ncbi:UDP-N-acetylglucosamine 1-carboxyvinyltransferase [Chlamydia trachomatis]|nr:UDP-N-acetylglucosamine 1-carboxyvinyltransferase [Chlamydia trachomatis]
MLDRGYTDWRGKLERLGAKVLARDSVSVYV